jgi:hypothetical protein
MVAQQVEVGIVVQVQISVSQPAGHRVAHHFDSTIEVAGLRQEAVPDGGGVAAVVSCTGSDNFFIERSALFPVP